MAEPIAPPGALGWPPAALDPAGPFAAPINTLSWILFLGGAVILLLVLAALGLALFGPRRWRALLGDVRLIWAAGLAIPVVILGALLIYGLLLTRDLSAEPRPGEMRVRVTGEMWWFRVGYLDNAGTVIFQEANEVHIPTGQPVAFELEATDVIHAFWAPRLGGKQDMIPGRRNLLRLQADKPGVYHGQCSEYCGGPHALMGFVIVAHSPQDFVRWRAARTAPPSPGPPSRGAAVFAAAGCGACHTVRGTPANGVAGPDLTHVGSRRTLGAGILPNNQGTLAGWIADSQAIKPGNRMPSYPVLKGEDLRAVAAYLASLK